MGPRQIYLSKSTGSHAEATGVVESESKGFFCGSVIPYGGNLS